MADEPKTKLRLEIAHVLSSTFVGYSKLLIDKQSEALQELNQIERNTEAAREAEAAGQLIILPTGDGMALVFTASVEEPVECALQISQTLRAQPSLPCGWVFTAARCIMFWMQISVTTLPARGSTSRSE